MTANTDLISLFNTAMAPLAKIAVQDGLSDKERELVRAAYDALMQVRSDFEVRTGAYHDWWEKYMPNTPVPDHVPKRPVTP